MIFPAGTDAPRQSSAGSASILPLLALRYRLIWAQLRKNEGRVGLLAAFSLLGLALFALINLCGAGVAFAGIFSGRREEFARWGLAGISISGIVAGMSLGAGPCRAFSVRALRRYPISPRRIMILRHLTGLLDPIWSFQFAAALGLAAGYALLGFGRLALGLPAVTLCVFVNYLATLIAFSLADCILDRKGGATILAAVLFALSAGITLAGPVLATRGNPGPWLMMDRLLVFLPPGNAASLLTGERQFSAAAMLVGWCLAMLLALVKLEQRTAQAGAASSPGTIGGWFYGFAERLFGGEFGALAARSLRYLLRSNRARFNLALSISMMVFMPAMMGRSAGPDGKFMVAIALFFCGGIFATSTTALNQFGYDGPAVRRYLLIPVGIAEALRASSIVSLLLGGAAILPASLLWAFTSEFSFDARSLPVLMSSALAGLFLFNAAGLWTSAIWPRNLNFNSVIGNQLSFAGNITMLGGVSLALGSAFVLIANNSIGAVLDHWWLFPALTLVCSGLYALSYRSVGGLLKKRCQRLVEELAGHDTV